MISIDFVSTSKPSGSKTYIINFCKELFNKKTFDKEITVFILKSYLDELNIEKKPENIKIVTKSIFKFDIKVNMVSNNTSY